ncbi:MAG: hypothetical protein WHS44_08020 [Fimbriimonadales bacterium]|nr:MAG: hypothetical protein KatS3mg018_0433 [Fimbriimonadales bacterium]
MLGQLYATTRTGELQNPCARLYRSGKNFAEQNWNLVVSFAVWGYNTADPNADAGVVYLSGVDALSRLLLVGSEWGSYATGVGGVRRGGVARGAAKLSGGSRLAGQSAELPTPRAGQKVYRVYGGEPTEVNAWMRKEYSGPMGRYWTPVDPRTVRNYRYKAGLPKENRGRFLIIGRIVDPTGVEVGRAAPICSNRGGLVEYKIPDPERQIEILRVLGLNPPL